MIHQDYLAAINIKYHYYKLDLYIVKTLVAIMTKFTVFKLFLC